MKIGSEKMDHSTNNTKIEKYLDELAEEYKTLLYNALVTRTEPLNELSVSELLRIDAEIKKPLLENYQKVQRRRRMLFFAGIVYMVTGIFMYLSSQIVMGGLKYDRENMISLVSAIISLIGLFIAIYSFASQTLGIGTSHKKKQRNNALPILEYEAVTKWRELEGIVNDMSANSRMVTPRSCIDFLETNHFINEHENIILKDFLKVRNNVVHSNTNEYTTEELEAILIEVGKIIEKLKKIM